MDYSAFAKGWDQKGEQNRQSRLDNLKLWSEYKKSNPYAKLNELQDYRDSLSGGSNYLGQVLPNGTVLEDLARRNQSNYDQSMLERTYGNMERRAKVMGTLQADIDNAIMQSGGKDLPNAAQSFIDQFPELANAPDVMKRIRGQFSEGRFNALKVKSIEDSMPTVTRLISANPNMSADDLAAATNLPKGIAEGALKQAKEQVRQKNFDWARTHQTRIEDEVYRFAQDGIKTDGDAVKKAIQAIGGNHVDLDKEYIDMVIGRVNQRVKTYNEQQTRERDNEMSQAVIGLETSISSDKNIASFVRRNDTMGLRDYITNRLVPRLPAYLRTKLQQSGDLTEIIDQSVEGAFTSGIIKQDENIDKSYEAFQKAEGAALSKAAKDNTDLASQYFGAGKKDPNAAGSDGQPHRNAALAAQNLAKQYAMTPQSLTTLQKAFATLPSGASLLELQAVGGAALQTSGALPFAATKNDMARRNALQTGRHLQVQRYADWRDGKDGVITKMFDQTKSKADAVVLGNNDTPEEKIRKLKIITQMMDMSVGTVEEELYYARQHAMGDDSWVKIERGGDGWNDDDYNVMNTKLRDQSTTLKTQIAEAIKKEEAKIAEAKEQAPTAVPNNENIRSATGDTSPIGRTLSNYFDAQGAGMALGRHLDQYKRQTSLFGQAYFNQTDAEVKAKEQLLEFVENAGGHQALATRIFDKFGPEAENGSTEKANAKVQEFMDNPTEFMKTNRGWLGSK